MVELYVGNGLVELTQRCVAAATLHMDRWDGGADDRKLYEPEGGGGCNEPGARNTETVAACRQKVLRTGKPQPCVLRRDPAGVWRSQF